MLKNRLEEIEKIMEASADYNEAEVRLWHVLTEHVDIAHFDRTGQILTKPIVIDHLLDQNESPEALQQALGTLMERGHITTVEKREGSEDDPATRYRLYLRPNDYGGN
jgi:hypothetical protein